MQAQERLESLKVQPDRRQSVQMNYRIDVCSGTIFDKRHPTLDNIPVKIVQHDKFYVQYNKIFRISVSGSFK